MDRLKLSIISGSILAISGYLGSHLSVEAKTQSPKNKDEVLVAEQGKGSKDIYGNHSNIWKDYLDSRAPMSDLAAGDTENKRILTNFSYAGYAHGEKPMPPKAGENFCTTLSGETDPVTGYRIFKVTDYGAVPNDGISDKEAIRKAINAIHEYVGIQSHSNLERGAILLFPEGRFIVHGKSDSLPKNSTEHQRSTEQHVVLKSSNTIVRGCGMDKTTLFQEIHLLAKRPKEFWSTPSLFNIHGDGDAETIGRVISEAFAGSSKSIELDQSPDLKVGDWVKLDVVVKDKKKVADAMAPYGHDKLWTMIGNGLAMHEYHQVVSVKGSKVTFTAPIQVKVDPADNWKLMKMNNFVVNSGFEDFTFEGNWKSEFSHHNTAIDDSGYTLLGIRNAADAWARDIKLKNFSQGLSVSHISRSTIRNIEMSGTPGHGAMYIQNSFNVLTQNVRDNSSAFHSPGFSHRTSSSVHMNGIAGGISSDLHGNMPRINLFDNCTSNWDRSGWGGGVAAMPNHLKGLVHWNPRIANQPMLEPFEFMNQGGGIITPFVVGPTGHHISFSDQLSYAKFAQKQNPDYPQLPQAGVSQAIEESLGKSVRPDSLYLAQVEQRLGYIPDHLIDYAFEIGELPAELSGEEQKNTRLYLLDGIEVQADTSLALKEAKTLNASLANAINQSELRFRVKAGVKDEQDRIRVGEDGVSNKLYCLVQCDNLSLSFERPETVTVGKIEASQYDVELGSIVKADLFENGKKIRSEETKINEGTIQEWPLKVARRLNAVWGSLVQVGEKNARGDITPASSQTQNQFWVKDKSLKVKLSVIKPWSKATSIGKLTASDYQHKIKLGSTVKVNLFEDGTQIRTMDIQIPEGMLKARQWPVWVARKVNASWQDRVRIGVKDGSAVLPRWSETENEFWTTRPNLKIELSVYQGRNVKTELTKTQVANTPTSNTFVQNGKVLSLKASQDAFVRGGDQAENSYGGSSYMGIENTEGNLAYKSMLRFDVSALAGKSVSSAKLKLYVRNVDSRTEPSVNLRAFAVDADWTEKSLTWMGWPDTTDVPVSSTISLTADSKSSWVELDVTDIVKKLNGKGTLDLALQNPEQKVGYIGLATKEYKKGMFAPELVINGK